MSSGDLHEQAGKPAACRRGEGGRRQQRCDGRQCDLGCYATILETSCVSERSHHPHAVAKMLHPTMTKLAEPRMGRSSIQSQAASRGALGFGFAVQLAAPKAEAWIDVWVGATHDLAKEAERKPLAFFAGWS